VRVQYGALPVTEQQGEPMVMLVTSRGTGRWIIPKGRPEKGVAPHKLAQREAWEEAGLIGRIQRKPIGRFIHPKRRADGSTVHCEIEVFRLDVEEELSDWPERGQRERCWCTLPEAIEKVGEHELAKLLQRFDGYPRKDPVLDRS
jgi:8-oxo-dGTP pyrophosphatase MutT (NUDIX family)